MTYSNDSLHVYLREIRQGERSSLSVLASFVKNKSRVLDLGMGSGALGRHLQQAGCVSDGVTINAEESSIAQSSYERIELADLDSAAIDELFAPQQYDYIVCADVLEHLKHPERVLAACRRLLAPGGKLLVSVPNAAYSGLIAELLAGDLRYRQEGLLDRTHLRFFTRRSLLRFLNENGWQPETIEQISLDLTDSEFQVAFDRLPPAVARYVLGLPDADTYQFVLAASAAQASTDSATDAAPSDVAPEQTHAFFTAQLYLGETVGYAEDRKLTAKGIIGQLRQTLVFDLPRLPGLTKLRLDPADRPGFLHLYQLTLRTGEGKVLWHWSGEVDGLHALESAPRHEILLQPPAALATGFLALLHGDDPWIELPIPAETLAARLQSAHCVLEVGLGWPMSADYLVMAQQVTGLGRRLAEQEARLVSERTLHGAEMEGARAQAQLLVDEQAQTLQALRRQSDETQRLQQHVAQLFEQKEESQVEAAGMQRQIARLETDLSQLAHHLEWIERSTIFRVTRPVVHMKMKLDQLLGRSSTGSPRAAPPAMQPMPANDTPVDVIVPVYRGLDDTRRCIQSALRCVNRTPMRLVVLNDASPEPEVTAWLREIAMTDSRIMLLENAENLGFVGTVNRGMSTSRSHDVVLLNSDTEVANDWLDRLRGAAYSGQRVGTVTPFSNNATICSYPRFCEANALPNGYTTAELDRLFASTLAGQTVDVPTGVGFCMYIRRDCLEQVGLFDVESFGKGYGEENDFSCRASAMGWRNLHALDVFVLHAGGVSFGSSKSARELAAMETLRRLHPDYESRVHQFLAVDPARAARAAVDLARARAESKPCVLAVMHDRAGGTLRHAKELAQHLAHRAVFFLLTPGAGQELSLRRIGDNEGFELSFRLPDEYEALVETLRSIGVRLIHFHHLLGHGAHSLALPARLGVPYDFTAHDFYTFCPQISLTDHTDRYCGEQGLHQCKQCLAKTPAPGGVSIENWRAHHAKFLAHARRVLVPSQDAAQRLARFVPDADVRYAPHTDMPAADQVPNPTPARLAADAPLRIAVIGALSPIKGADVLEDVASAATRAGLPLEFHLIGYAYRSLRTQPRAALTVHGQYEDHDLPSLLEWLKPDLVWFPAQWPETYSYTLSACLRAGLPVVAPDLGAFQERLQGRAWSWVARWNLDVPAWLALFTKARSNFIEGVAPPSVWPIQVAANACSRIGNWSYEEEYLAALGNEEPQPASLSQEFLFAHRPRRPHAGLSGTRRELKERLLRLAVRLRSAPLLRSLARAIPLRWQTRVKNWLRA